MRLTASYINSSLKLLLHILKIWHIVYETHNLTSAQERRSWELVEPWNSRIFATTLIAHSNSNDWPRPLMIRKSSAAFAVINSNTTWRGGLWSMCMKAVITSITVTAWVDPARENYTFDQESEEGGYWTSALTASQHSSAPLLNTFKEPLKTVWVLLSIEGMKG